MDRRFDREDAPPPPSPDKEGCLIPYQLTPHPLFRESSTFIDNRTQREGAPPPPSPSPKGGRKLTPYALNY